MENKKAQAGFQIGDLWAIGVTLMVLAIILGVGQTILGSIADQQTPSGWNESELGNWDNTYDYNTTIAGQSGIKILSDYQETIALVAVAAVIVGIVLVFFGRG